MGRSGAVHLKKKPPACEMAVWRVSESFSCMKGTGWSISAQIKEVLLTGVAAYPWNSMPCWVMRSLTPQVSNDGIGNVQNKCCKGTLAMHGNWTEQPRKFSFSLFPGVCVCVCVRAHMHVHICVCVV